MQLNRSRLAVAVTVATGFISSVTPAQEVQEEVLVTGIRSSLENALDVKRDADSFVDAISSEDIGKFPDQNIAESLQRVTGVTIDREGGEGAKVTVRGFGPEFNQVRLNNRQLATITGGRDFDFQVLASELIHRAAVSKSPTASEIEGSLGGTVYLETLRPLDNAGFQAAGSIKGRYQDLSEDWGPLLSGLVSNTFADDTMGVVFALAYQDIEQRLDNTFNGVWGDLNFDPDGDDGPQEAIAIRRPNRAGFSLETEQRERLGVSSTFQWQPSDTVEVAVDGFLVDFTRSKESLFNMHPMQVAFNANNVIDYTVNENGTLTHVVKADQPNDMGLTRAGGDITTQALGGNIKWDISENVSMEFDAAWSNAESEDLGVAMFPGMRYQCDPADTTECDAAASIDSNRVEWHLDDIVSLVSSFDLTDPSLMRAHFNNSIRDDREDDITELKLDFDWVVDYGILSTVQFGAAYLDRRFDTRRFDNQGTNGFNPFGQDDPDAAWTNTDRTRSNGRILDLPDELFEVIRVPDLLDEAKGAIPREWLITRDYDTLCNALVELSGNSLGCTLSFNPRESSFVEETDTALYVQFDLQGDIGNVPFSGNIGLRHVETETTSNGFSAPLIDIEARDPTGGTTGLDPVYGEEQEVIITNDYSDVLPSLNLKFNLTEELQLRTAASKTLTRPDTGDLGTALTYGGSFEGFNRTGDNPFLGPYEATNFDLGLEYYAGGGSAYSVTLFYKDINDFISTVVTPFDTGFSHPALGPIVGDDRRLQNRPGGTIEGFELGALVFFDFFDGIWANFGVQANYTYVDGDDEAAGDVVYPDPQNVKEPDSGLEGFTPHSYNLIGFYEDDRFQARLAWNYRSDYMDVRVGGGQLPEQFESYTALDFSTSYEVTDYLEVTFEALNLLNENTLRYADRRERVLDNEYTGRRFTLGLRAKY